MSSFNGDKLNITVFGGSHTQEIGVVVQGLPLGLKVDRKALAEFMSRRAPGGAFSTKRKEPDLVEFKLGLDENDVICSNTLRAVIKNTDVRSKDYGNIKLLPRPSHADYSAYMKYGLDFDMRGGAHFSGRLTAPLCIVGGICMQYLKEKGIEIGAHLSSVGKVSDVAYDKVLNQIESNQADFPAIDIEKSKLMQKEIVDASNMLDSVGATIECKAINVPVGLGDHPFDGVENKLAQVMFAIPGVKGFEMGLGFESSCLLGSQNNDTFTFLDGKVVTKTNNSGGVNGGITNGMPLVFKVALKTTPSIAKPQTSVNLETMQEEILEIKGRHDPCIGVRAVPVVQACTAIVLMDLIK